MTIKVAHLSTSNRGGAAVAAQQLSLALNQHGISSTLISRENLGTLRYGIFKNFKNRVLGKLVTQFQSINTRTPYGIATPISISNLNVTTLLKNDYDILHIHNWYNLLSVNDLKKLAHYVPIVFTFHDERLLTGGCHTTLGCENFKESCQKCPAVRINENWLVSAKHDSKDFFLNSTNVSVISPSKWIVGQIQAAGLDKHLTSIAHIPNIISADYFSADIQTENLSIPCKLLFISANLGTEVKGLSLLLDALNLLSLENDFDHPKNIELHLVGGGDVPSQVNKHIRIVRHGFLNQQEIRDLITESSFLVVPSLSENSPNVIAEAQLMGLPVIGSRVAGIPELIEDSVTGFLGKPNPRGISEALRRALTSKVLYQIASEAQSRARVRYDIPAITRAHLDVYKKALANK